MTPEIGAGAIRDFRDTFAAVRREVGRVVIGHEPAVEAILTAFFAGGHVLIEGVPGIGKTLMVRALAEALSLSFSRVQFTVDLMPADVTGTGARGTAIASSACSASAGFASGIWLGVSPVGGREPPPLPWTSAVRPSVKGAAVR